MQINEYSNSERCINVTKKADKYEDSKRLLLKFILTLLGVF